MTKTDTAYTPQQNLTRANYEKSLVPPLTAE